MFLLAPRETSTEIAPGLDQTQTFKRNGERGDALSTHDYGAAGEREKILVNNPLANFGKIWPKQHIQKRQSSAMGC